MMKAGSYNVNGYSMIPGQAVVWLRATETEVIAT